MAKASEVNYGRKSDSQNGGAQNNANGSQKNYPKNFKMTSEEDYIRYMPPHTDEYTGCANLSVVWLPCQVAKKDANGNRIPNQTQTKNIRIFNGKLHGKLSKDLLQEYMFFAIKKMKEKGFDKEFLRSALCPVNGLWNKERRVWTYPILRYSEYKAFWVFHRETNDVELLEMDSKAFTEYYIKMNDDLTTKESPLGLDVICDVQMGQYVKVFKNAEKKTAYTLERCPSRLPAEIAAWQEGQITSQEALEKHKALTPVDELYKDSFNRFQYTMQLNYLKKLEENLANYEAKWNGESKSAPYNFLQDPEFIAIAEGIANEVDKFYPSNYNGDNNQNQDSNPTKPQETPKETSENAGDEFDKMDRNQLKAYVMDNELDVRVVSSLSDDDVRCEIRNAIEFKAAISKEPSTSKSHHNTSATNRPTEAQGLSGGFDTNDDDGLPF